MHILIIVIINASYKYIAEFTLGWSCMEIPLLSVYFHNVEIIKDMKDHIACTIIIEDSIDPNSLFKYLRLLWLFLQCTDGF